jgi:hypothetical protein
VATLALPLVVPFFDESPVVVAVPLLPPWACDQLPLIPPPAMMESAAPAAPVYRRTADSAVIAISVFFIASSVSG